jgi:hypothetical protein
MEHLEDAGLGDTSTSPPLCINRGKYPPRQIKSGAKIAGSPVLMLVQEKKYLQKTHRLIS